MCTRTVLFISGSITIWILVASSNHIQYSLCHQTIASTPTPIEYPNNYLNYHHYDDHKDIHNHMTYEERIILLGHHNEVPQYQVISSPHWTSKSVSHLRLKRSIGQLNQPIQVAFEAFGEPFRLLLWPNHGLLSPAFHLINKQNESDIGDGVHHRDWSSRKRLLDCFYQGYDEAHGDSAAAISLCNGMQGVIETKTSIYMVNPVPQATAERLFAYGNSTTQRFHLILKRTNFDHYQCPHGHHHISKWLSNLKKDHKQEEQIRGRIKKRSIDIAASNRNFLDADKTTSTTNKMSTTSTTTIRPLPESINEVVDEFNLTNGSQNHSPPFNITVETAVFVDESLYHILSKTFPIDTEQQIVLYVLTIMNAVQLLFKQPSIGRSVDISVVLMDLLRQQPKNLTPSDNIDTYLTNFCVWQHKKRLRETGGPTPDWDHALLLSGINMYVVDGYGRRKRHVVGLAPVSGMCNSLNSCTISEGTNFQTVLVAGHEMGHSLGMEHDGSQDGNLCNKDDFVMSPTLGPGKTTWSKCSKHYLDKFVLTPQATCVLGRSSHVNIIHQFIPPHRLPGERFNVDEQCRFRFGPTARHHSSQHKSEICRVIKCFVKSSDSKHGFYSGRGLYSYPVKSTYNTHPALEGSECGLEKWCREGRCVPKPQISNGLDIENNLIVSNGNRYVKLNRNTTGLFKTNGQMISKRISNRQNSVRKRPTEKPKSNSDGLKKNDPYHFKLVDKSWITSTTPTTTNEPYLTSVPVSSASTSAPSTVLLMNNILKAKHNSSKDLLHWIDPNVADYDADYQHNPYTKPSNNQAEILNGQHWSSNRLNQQPLIPINGNWSEWSDYGPCISECVSPDNISRKIKGGSVTTTETIGVPLGVQISLRRCDKPIPKNGGQDCSGPDTRVKLCNAIKVCSAASSTSAASGIGAKHRTTLDGNKLGKRYQIRSVDEYISDTCLAAAKLNDKIENHGTQYPSYDSASHSCYVWCFKRDGGFMTQGWRFPDGTPCGRKMAQSSSADVGPVSKDLIQISGYCYNGQCRQFNCRGEIFFRQSFSSLFSSTNVYNVATVKYNQNLSSMFDDQHQLFQHNCPATYHLSDIINELEDQTIDELDPNNYDSTYRLVQKMKPTTVTVISKTPKSSEPTPVVSTSLINPSSSITNSYMASNWSEWHPVTECQYSVACIQHGRGFRLVTRTCQRQTCLGRREALQVCPEIMNEPLEPSSTMYDLYEHYCPINKRRTADQYAQAICQKYQIKFSSLLSGNGRQLIGAKNYGCIVACEDRLWKDIHYQMDAFEDGKFPFGTDCSTKDRRGYCLNGKCIHFDHSGISYDTEESILYRNEILQLFAPSTIYTIEPTMYGSFDGSISPTTFTPLHHSMTPDSLYSAIFNNEIYKRATSNIQTVEYQPAYQSFIASRRFKRDLTFNDSHSIFRKATVQEQNDPEEDYVSWSMLKHHRYDNHHRQYRRPITRTMKKSSLFSNNKINWSPLVLKSLRPIKLTSVSRKRKFSSNNSNQDHNTNHHFQTFTLVKPFRHKYNSLEPSSLLMEQIGIPLAKNYTTFLDDNDDDQYDEEDEQNPTIDDSASEKKNSTIKLDLSSHKKKMVKFSLGHESWPPTTTPLSSSDKFRDNKGEIEGNENEENDDYGQVDQTADQLRVEPYVWSVILSECNRPCGQGVRTVRVVCTVGQRSVQEHFCDQHSKPIHKSIEYCKQRDCIGKWRVEPWSQCFSISNRCNQTGSTQSSVRLYQSRTIACVGPMMAYERYEPTFSMATERRLSSRSSHLLTTRDQIDTINNMSEVNGHHKSPRIFSLLSHDYCDPMTKPSQWRPCESNQISFVNCKNGE